MAANGIEIQVCVNNLSRHQYGAKLNELAKEGVTIRLERCLSACAGCSRQPAFAAAGKWIGVGPNEDYGKSVYAAVGSTE